VGDSWKNDIVGAKQAGWSAIWLNRHALPLPLDVTADAVVSDDGQLYDYISRKL
jgi:putative hydrolase of the HAD superfamily